MMERHLHDRASWDLWMRALARWRGREEELDALADIAMFAGPPSASHLDRVRAAVGAAERALSGEADDLERQIRDMPPVASPARVRRGPWVAALALAAVAFLAIPAWREPVEGVAEAVPGGHHGERSRGGPSSLSTAPLVRLLGPDGQERARGWGTGSRPVVDVADGVWMVADVVPVGSTLYVWVACGDRLVDPAPGARSPLPLRTGESVEVFGAHAGCTLVGAVVPEGTDVADWARAVGSGRGTSLPPLPDARVDATLLAFELR